MNRNIKYWTDYWSSLLSGIENRQSKLTLLNPRIVLRELIYEIRTMSLRNFDNRDFLFGKVNEYFDNDPPTRKCLQPILTLIRHEFNQPRLDILVQLCQQCISIMNSFEYFDAAVDYLQNALLDMVPITREKISLVCQDLIVELLEFGYSQKFIESIPKRLFDGIKQHGDNFVSTDFPHDIEYPKDESDIEAKELYRKFLESYMDSLSDKDRIDAIKKFPRLPYQKLKFIFQVRGLRGTGSFDIGNIHFYSPSTEKAITNNFGFTTNKDLELFQSTTDTIYFNAILSWETRDIHAGYENARRLLIEAVNFLRYSFSSRAQYEISRDYIAIQENGRLAGMSLSLSERQGYLHWHDSLNITDDILNSINDSNILKQFAPKILSEEKDNLIYRKILDSLHWFRKGIDAEANEDQLIWLWISIENLLSPSKQKKGENLLRNKGKENVISNVINLLPRLRCATNAYKRGWGLFKEIYHISSIPKPLGGIEIPEDLKNRAGLQKSKQKIYLQSFIAVIPEICKYMEESVLKDNLSEAYIFYTDKNSTLSVMEKELKSFRNDIVMLYRMRNKIVHNALISDTTLPYYIRSASQFSTELIKKFLFHYFHKSNNTIEGIVSALFVEYDLLIENIKFHGPMVALFKEK